MALLRTSLLFLLSTALTACGNGSGDADFNGDFSGVWDVRYNLTTDECFLVEEGLLGFVDRQVILDSNPDIALESTIGPASPHLGSHTDEPESELSSFLASLSLTGDLFGDGDSCTLTQEISYEATGEDSASSLFLRTITCGSGFRCSSRALGSASRQPGTTS